MADVFISYEKTDRSHAERLAAALAKEGWEIWWDPQLEPGDDFDEIIENQLNEARCVVVLWSERSRKSRYVKGEARDAMEQGKLVPVFIEEKVKPPHDFRSIQGVFLYGWNGNIVDAEYLKLTRRVLRQIEEDDPGQTIQTRKHQQPTKPMSFFEAPGTIYRDRLQGGGEGPEMVVIPSGSFIMGSPEDEVGRYDAESPQHEVTIAKPFAMGRYPVTFEEYDRFYQSAFGRVQTLEKPGDEDWGRGRQPVIFVSWKDALAYCEWLSKQTSKPYRLPTEAEWEYACRAGTTTAYWWGMNPGGKHANFIGSGSQWSGMQTSPVGSFDPNPAGLYDMLGNVWEWCQDCWWNNYDKASRDGMALKAYDGGDCSRRVLRGGSWGNRSWSLRCANRSRFDSGNRSKNVGFRLARDYG